MNEREIRNEQVGIGKIDISRIAAQIAREDLILRPGERPSCCWIRKRASS